MNKLFSRLNRWISWLLATVLLCAGVPAVGAGEAAADTDNDFALLDSLLGAVLQDPAEGVLLETLESIGEYCRKLYGLIDPDVVPRVYYGGPDDAAELLPAVGMVLYGTDFVMDVMLESAEILYVGVWSLIHADLPSEYKTRPVVKEIMSGWLDDLPADNISVGVDACIDYIERNEPELVQSGYNINRHETTISGSDEYLYFYQQGYQLFEEGRYGEAIEAYIAALSFKENDCEASLEIAQAYIAMRDYTAAKEWLMKTLPYVTENFHKARWLRSYGFIAIEELSYELGYALYRYSLEFEQSQNAVQEMQYIMYVAPNTKDFTAEEASAFLADKGIVFGN